MFEGVLVGIRTADQAAGVMVAHDSVEAVEGEGLRGDRYAELRGKFQRGRIEADQQVTLIESEAIEAAGAGYDLEVTHESSRRNLLTRGVPLNHLVGRTFRVGSVLLRGIRLCEPCSYLDKVSGKGHLEALKHRGGLRAQIVSGGTLAVGDVVEPAENASA